MLIDCDTCTARGTGCADCVVTVLLGAPPGWQSVDPVVVPMTGARASRRPGRRLGRVHPEPSRRTSSSRRRASWWSSTRSSAGPSGPSPTSAWCRRCGIGGPRRRPDGARQRPSDGLTRVGRTGPHQVTFG